MNIIAGIMAVILLFKILAIVLIVMVVLGVIAICYVGGTVNRVQGEQQFFEE